jgi:hypothetical protein
MPDIEKINAFFNTSPSIKLIRALSAPKILAFFYYLFKETPRPFIAEEQLILHLADFLKSGDIEDEETQNEGLFVDLEAKSRQLINSWTERNFLRNYETIDNQIVYELTAHSEKVLQWLGQLDQQEFIGTESRFKDIFNKLQELIANTTEDVEKKITDLEEQKQQIEAEIRQIKISGKVRIYDNYQIKSRIREITQSAKELLSDFKEVEDNFKTITRNIYQKHTDPAQTKGNILNYTFDALDELKESDQGKSFYAFWEFLIAQNRQDQWKELINRIFSLLDERSIFYDDVFLRKLKNYLYKSGQKVSEANDRMSDKLSRVISEKELAERIKVKESINRIKELALTFIERDEFPRIGMEIEHKPEISMPLERKLTLEKAEIPVFDSRPQPAANQPDAEKLSELYTMFSVDKQRLLKRIKLLLEDKTQVTLKEVLDLYPLEKGLSELIAYFSLADSDCKTIFNKAKPDLVEFDRENRKCIEIPQIIFAR